MTVAPPFRFYRDYFVCRPYKRTLKSSRGWKAKDGLVVEIELNAKRWYDHSAAIDSLVISLRPPLDEGGEWIGHRNLACSVVILFQVCGV